MSAPIFVFDTNTVEIFESVAAAERYLEPPDIEDLTILDGKGRSLIPTIVQERVPLMWGLFSTSRDRVLLRQEEPVRLRIETFTHLLRKHLQLVDDASPWEDLVQRAIESFGYAR